MDNSLAQSNSQLVNSEPIGLIGLGLVGSALATRLTSGGFGVMGFDKDPAKFVKKIEKAEKSAKK